MCELGKGENYIMGLLPRITCLWYRSRLWGAWLNHCCLTWISAELYSMDAWHIGLSELKTLFRFGSCTEFRLTLFQYMRLQAAFMTVRVFRDPLFLGVVGV